MDHFSEITQTLLAGIVMGGVYGLIAFGFVLIFKATEVINFAQEEMMVIGVFFANTLVGLFHLNYRLPLLLTKLHRGDQRPHGEVAGNFQRPVRWRGHCPETSDGSR